MYADTTMQYRLRPRSLSRPADPPIVVSSETWGVGRAVWSADGTTLVYTVYDQPQNCDHLERVTWDGAAWSAPVRVRDGAQTAEFIADIAWVTVALASTIERDVTPLDARAVPDRVRCLRR